MLTILSYTYQIYYRQTYQSSCINQNTIVDKMIYEKQEEKIVLESNKIAQSESQIIEDEDDTAIFDAPQKKSISKPKSNNCLKVEESKSKDQNTTKSMESNNIAQSVSQIIEDESSPTMDLSECIGDVSYLFLSHLTICIKTKLHKKYIAADHHRF